MKRRDLLAALSASAIVLGCPGAGMVLATPAAPPEKLVHDAANRFLDVVRNGAHRDEIADTLDRYVAMKSLALFVLGKHRRKLKADQQQAYVDLFNSMILKIIAKNGKKVRGSAFVVTGSRGKIVRGYVQHDQNRRTEVEFRVKKDRISDIGVGGIWMGILLRQSFDHVISRGGGIDAIFLFLKSGKVPL
ncbi:MAG: MlaC/ttg2D family ABC transporter substrate-binding protein [Anderseniella sp.]